MTRILLAVCTAALLAGPTLAADRDDHRPMPVHGMPVHGLRVHGIAPHHPPIHCTVRHHHRYCH
jgi:hypothetical protein